MIEKNQSCLIMVEIFIDEKPFEVDDGITVIQACEQAGVEIPRFCYHEKLSMLVTVECV